MAFSHLLTSAVDTIINKYLDNISETFKIDKTALKALWDSNTHNVNLHKVSATPNVEGSLAALTKTELQTHCKARGVKSTGTKQEIIDRLSGSTTTTATNVKKPNAPRDTIAKLIKTQIAPISIEGNRFGNYEHYGTHFVFDKISQEVIGKQNENGNIDQLTYEDIDNCNKHKFKYVLPENLNISKPASDEIEIEDDQIGEVLEDDEDDDEILEDEEPEDEFVEDDEDDE